MASAISGLQSHAGQWYQGKSPNEFSDHDLSPDECRLGLRKPSRGPSILKHPSDSPTPLLGCSGPYVRWDYDGFAGRDHDFVMQVPIRPATASVARSSGPMMTRAFSLATLLRKSTAP